jgi:predicted O-methyltransferase YrrM
MFDISPMRPIAPLYRADERFEISRAGLAAWQASDSFARVAAFYAGYPSRALQNDNGKTLLHHLIVMQRPQRVLEIGTYQAGTTEVIARALHEAGSGHVETIDPFGGDVCPPLIEAFPAELKQRITFSAVSSAAHFDRAMTRGEAYDLVLVDGNHELEYARFDLECAARLMRPGGLVVLDNIEQPGPRFATRRFLDEHKAWRDLAGVVGRLDLSQPLAEPEPSFPGTKYYLLQAPPHYVVGVVPRSFGLVPTEHTELGGLTLDLAAPAWGTLHLQAFLRTFGILHPEELRYQRSLALDAPAGRLELAIDPPLRTAIRQEGLSRRVEIVLAFTGPGDLALRAPPLTHFLG